MGDLEEDSALPFNIPQSTSNKSSSGSYLVPLKLEYYDDLRNQYVIYESESYMALYPSNLLMKIRASACYSLHLIQWAWLS
ncbi:hypothetical protein [Candidatus Nitrosocosmicus sp. R]